MREQGRSEIRTQCKLCRNKYLQDWRNKHPGANSFWYRAKLGVTPDLYNKMKVSQDNKCAICKEMPLGLFREDTLHVDHCHKTNKVRGLLCVNCNKMLGHAKDNINILLQGIAYLQKDKE